MKKTLTIIAIVLSALLLLGIIGAVFLLSNGPSQERTQEALPDYIHANWASYQVESYEEGAGVLTLRKDQENTYDEICKYGKAAGYDEVAAGHLDTMQTMLEGCKVACGVELTEIIIRGYSSDGQIVYTVSSNGQITACWS